MPTILTIVTPATAAEPVYAPLDTLLVDQAGWTAEPAIGAFSDEPGKSPPVKGMVKADRTYTKGEVTVEVSILTGTMLMPLANLPFSMPDLTSTEETSVTQRSNGHTIHLDTKQDHTATLAVQLAAGKGVLSFIANGLDAKGVLAFGQGFDWPAADAAVTAIH